MEGSSKATVMRTAAIQLTMLKPATCLSDNGRPATNLRGYRRDHHNQSDPASARGDKHRGFHDDRL
jgi:hypothetical protein